MSVEPLPHVFAEVAVLGAALLSAEALAGVAELLEPDDFENDAHRTTFAALRSMHRDGMHADPITLTDALAARGRLDEVGGAAGLHELTTPESCSAPAAWRSYADIVRNAGERRRAIRHLRRALARLEAGAPLSEVRGDLAAVTP